MEYEIAQEIWNLIYPIGSVYMSKNSTDPSTLFGGTWERIKGRVIVGVDENDADFNMVLKTGGSKYLQHHTHKYLRHHFWWGERTDHDEILGASSTVQGRGILVDSNGPSDVQTGNSGNLQPYITLYIWIRTN